MENESTNQDEIIPKSNGKPDQPEEKRRIPKAMWILVLILLAGIVISIGLKQIGENRLRKKANKAMVAEQKENLKLVILPLSWAISSEVGRDNLEYARRYIQELGDEKNMVEIMLAEPGGSIFASTNTTHEKTNLNDHFTAEMQTGSQQGIVVNEGNDGQLVAMAPVLKLNERVGTVVIVFKAEGLDF